MPDARLDPVAAATGVDVADLIALEQRHKQTYYCLVGSDRILVDHPKQPRLVEATEVPKALQRMREHDEEQAQEAEEQTHQRRINVVSDAIGVRPARIRDYENTHSIKLGLMPFRARIVFSDGTQHVLRGLNAAAQLVRQNANPLP